MFQEKYNYLNSDFSVREHRPVIGITGNYDNQKCTLAEGYYKSVLRAGGIPVIIPPFRIPNVNGKKALQDLEDYLDSLDGILFSGGGDINPLLLGEQPVPQLHSVCPERDEQELLLVRLAYDRQIPMLGICKGIQIITAALGGELYQDIYSQEEGVTIKHSQDMPREYASHTVRIDADTILHEVFQNDEIAVNSFHHQAVKTAAPGMRVSARSSDGVIEAVESTEFKSILAVQWHPECLEDDSFDGVATANVPLSSANSKEAKPLFA
ncbi:MAG: gamma-glutamyl-gamma-aminobutyrate hydrolase family protein, partial [Bacteroidaceae bacterium]|nr:gamma-glutamyl-gamma-aminobutyrate hydrolase family protein [Bacteroidaceae bacterium]